MVEPAPGNVAEFDTHERFPEPSVFNTCPDVPSAVGHDKPSIIILPEPLAAIDIFPFVVFSFIVSSFNLPIYSIFPV